MSSISAINVDYTHVGRHVSGMERITIEQFNNVALSPLPIRTYKASENRLSIVAGQMIGLPAHAVRNPSDIYIFPGFPPSPFFSLLRDRAVLYVHDLFLLTRRTDLNRAAKFYMAPMFSVAVKKFRFFLTNSVDTAKKLRAYCHPDAVIVPYRPHIRNVFGVTVAGRLERPGNPDKIQVVSIGTIEPRKNFIGAAKICDALSRLLGCEIRLHIIGRVGWCANSHELRNRPNVTLHGYLNDAEARPIIESSDLLLCTSHEEGLCLPLIEGQYSGVAVAAPKSEIFQEVLGRSGIFIDATSPESAAARIADAITTPGWRSQYAAAAEANIRRWNGIAEKDRSSVIAFLAQLGARHVGLMQSLTVR